MSKKDNIKTFIDEIYFKPHEKNYETNKILNNHIIDKFSKQLWAIPFKRKNSQAITNEFSNNITSSKRSPLKSESDRGKEWFNSIVQSFLKSKNIQHYSRFTDNGPSIAERVLRTVRNLLKKTVLEKGNADWISELPSVIKENNISIHSSEEMTPNQASKKSHEKEVCSNLQDRRVRQQTKNKLGQLVRTADIKRVFSKGDSTNYSFKLYTITEVLHNTIYSYILDYLPDRYNENLLPPTKLSLEENNQVMKKLKLIQKKQ